MTSTLWLYWETPKGVGEVPPHILLCRKSIAVHARSHEVVLVTPDNLRGYLPDISGRIFEIEAQPNGRVDRYFNRRGRKVSAIAQRADFVRAFLLEKYGGLYIDSDTLLLADPAPYLALLESYDFFAVRRSSRGKTHVSVNFYGSRPHGVIVSEYAELLRRRLKGSPYYHWNEVGAAMLTPVVERHRAISFDIPEQEIQPVTFETAEHLFLETSVNFEDVVAPEARAFMLYHGPFKGPLKNTGLDELYRSDMLVSKAFRAAIPEEAYLELRGAPMCGRR